MKDTSLLFRNMRYEPSFEHDNNCIATDILWKLRKVGRKFENCWLHKSRILGVYCNIRVDCLFFFFFFSFEISAVYTGIKKPESFSHSGFSLKVARQLPLNTPKNPNWKTHLRSVIFWNSAEISLVFCQCKRSLQSRRYYSGFWSRGTWPSAESPDRGPRRNAHGVYGQR